MKMLPSQLGINIHLAGIRHFKLDEQKALETILSLPYQHLRIPIPLDEVSPKKGMWDFSVRDQLIEQAIKHNKTIHLQSGAKTIGWPEIWLPQWLKDKYPYIDHAHSQIDKEEEVQEFILEALEKIGKRYFQLSNLASIQIENEAFCRRLPVSNYRYISFSFHKKELEVVKKHNKKDILVLQNVPLNHPLDMLQSLPYVIRHSDVLGLNIYNQHIPSDGYQKVSNVFLSTITNMIVSTLQKKQIYVTELQTAAWLLGNKTPIKPFSLDTFHSALKQYLNLGASIVFLWDVEQILWEQNKKHLALFMHLTA